MIEAYPAAADDFLPYVGKAGNMSALRQFCLIVAAIFRLQLCYRPLRGDGEYLMQDFHSPLHQYIQVLDRGLPDLNLHYNAPAFITTGSFDTSGLPLTFKGICFIFTKNSGIIKEVRFSDSSFFTSETFSLLSEGTT